jgi:uncharacterized SAM-binding protein YcdF (DUF218 family)
MLVVFVLGAILILYGAFWDKLQPMMILKIILLLITISPICLSIFLGIYGSHNTADYTEDVVIILGAGVHGDRASIPLARRLDTAIEYYNKNPDVIFIVTGGQGAQETATEAEVMKKYLVSRDIPGSIIIEENRATSTTENFRYSLEILHERFPNGFSAAFITTNFHIYRAENLAQYEGISARHLSSSTQWHTATIDYARECLAVLKMWVFPPKAGSSGYYDKNPKFDIPNFGAPSN